MPAGSCARRARGVGVALGAGKAHCATQATGRREEGRGGFGTQKFVHQKWPDQISPIVNFIVSRDGHFGLKGGGGSRGGGPPPTVVSRSNVGAGGSLCLTRCVHSARQGLQTLRKHRLVLV